MAAPHTHPAFDFRDAHTARFLPLWSVVPDERVSATGTDVMRVWATSMSLGNRNDGPDAGDDGAALVAVHHGRAARRLSLYVARPCAAGAERDRERGAETERKRALAACWLPLDRCDCAEVGAMSLSSSFDRGLPQARTSSGFRLRGSLDGACHIAPRGLRRLDQGLTGARCAAGVFPLASAPALSYHRCEPASSAPCARYTACSERIVVGWVSAAAEWARRRAQRHSKAPAGAPSRGWATVTWASAASEAQLWPQKFGLMGLMDRHSVWLSSATPRATHARNTAPQGSNPPAAFSPVAHSFLCARAGLGRSLSHCGIRSLPHGSGGGGGGHCGSGICVAHVVGRKCSRRAPRDV